MSASFGDSHDLESPGYGRFRQKRRLAYFGTCYRDPLRP